MNSWKGVKIWTLGIGSVPLDEFKLLSCQNWRIYLQDPLQGQTRALLFILKPQDLALPGLGAWWKTFGHCGCTDMKGCRQWLPSQQVIWLWLGPRTFCMAERDEEVGVGDWLSQGHPSLLALARGSGAILQLLCIGLLPLLLLMVLWFRLKQRRGLEFTWILLALWVDGILCQLK